MRMADRGSWIRWNSFEKRDITPPVREPVAPRTGWRAAAYKTLSNLGGATFQAPPRRSLPLQTCLAGQRRNQLALRQPLSQRLEYWRRRPPHLPMQSLGVARV